MEKPVILVVEDNEIQRKVINLLAHEYGYQAVLAGSCAEACDAFTVGGDIYKLVLMDFRLPDANGTECSLRIREMEKAENRKVPIVAMTGYVGINDRQRCVEAGFDDCLIKPFSSTEFRMMVEKWIGRDTGNLVIMPRRADGST
jgi:CheY-like chemotaxis protein